MQGSVNCVVLLGPTAVGKTSLAVKLADYFNWEIISADCRQVYKGLDLGSGKDLSEYSIVKKDCQGRDYKKEIPYHLIDVTTLDSEYNVFNFQRDFYNLFRKLNSEKKMAFVCGGTGMYVDSIIRGYDFVPVEENKELRAELEKKSIEELGQILLSLKPDLHNKSDLLIRERIVRAIEIETFMRSPECAELRKELPARPDLNILVIGTSLERPVMRQNIKIRLQQRMDSGMIDEVQGLHQKGYSWERLDKLGLEYRYISDYLQGKISSVEEMTESLYHAICQFAKRQETWFRGMEKKGVTINWLPKDPDKEIRFGKALEILGKAGIS
ncbi:tRNA (adenosine(37)-N6)-dimethylallyltransferase MiaA [Treponema sp.]|uniref:tRNA (adenosine(37)-N6)-dimethylallyltransferase MiaA n=1 Tax=Treponema sp. TaxID=166 RepID=UPI0025D8DBFC|nr:tRNA (adenosine(37)-N6)-dimethylallyltransferase MiaA [Treponema sp.]MCR5219183.1 tRNA (adenosine(37)-N6)-dimethylallyltransferase MiaA [Treponema sp.]